MNLLTGYGGLVSLGSASFMAVGVLAAYNFNLRLPGLPLPVTLLLAAATSAAAGLVFGLPSLRLRGFYLAVSTLAAQFFVQWVVTNFNWSSNDNAFGIISAPAMSVLDFSLNGTQGRYAAGFIAYLNLINICNRGVNGVKLTWDECETEYAAEKGVECYQRQKSHPDAAAWNPLSVGIAYAMNDGVTADKTPLITINHGRTDTTDGRVFP